MDPERWRRIEELYHLALEQEPAQQNRFLAEGCRDDAELREEVESLLAQNRTTEHLVDKKAWAEAGDLEATRTVLTAGARLGPYQILGVLGQGGMGKVYRGLDTRLDRAVAIKISAEQFSNRFEREARAISALNHPHICTLYDVGPDYMVTELVEGETLRDWLKRAPAVERSIEIARQVLEALRAAHHAGIVHRDLKPQNIMVRPDGYVKVLDFGLAKRMPVSGGLPAEGTVSMGPSLPGQILGTVAYMSPEQILVQEVDQRSDLFAFGIVLYEMLTGGHPWPRRSDVDTLHAILHDDPPPIQAVWAGVVDKLLRKNREERYSSAEEVLDALAAPPQAAPSRALTRLIVLPFRLLRRHEASDFLAVSLPDAITSSLAAIDSLEVRSTMTAAHFAASTELDVNAIAEQAQVDAILTGTILSDGEHLRVTTQLVEAPSSTVLWSNTSQVTLRDIFQLQDELVDRILQSLTVPLTARERRALKHDVPASAIAYELYLRANHLATMYYDPQNMVLARDVYLRSVEADPKYAPAWAGLGRSYRLIGKCVEDLAENLSRADDAFRKAFALNPDLALAHNFYTSLQTDLGHPLEAMERLLKRAHMHRNDPNLLAGLIHACRYCGLLEASVGAHELARRLDPHVRTTVAHAYLDLGDFQRAIDSCGPDWAVAVQALIALGRKQEAIAYCLESEKTIPLEQLRLWAGTVRVSLEGDRKKSLELLDQALELPGPLVNDPESHYWIARELANLNESERALNGLSLALDSGYRCHYALLHDPRLDSLRAHRQFTELVMRAAALDLEARTVFLDNGGDRLLGVHMDSRLPEPVPASPQPLQSIAVLPFVFLHEVEERKALSLGFADSLITMLGSLEDFAVLPTSAILNYAAGTEPAQTCRNLGVRHVLQGNVQRLGSHWRVSMQLFDGMTQKIAYSEKHDFVREDVFEVQDEIGRRVVEALQSRFPRTVRKSRDRYSSDPEAFDEFMAGLRESYSDGKESLRSADGHLSRAVERDPEFALAHAWLSHVSMQIHFYFDTQRTWLEKAEHHCHRALALDPELPEGHWARSAILWSPAKNFQHADAIAALEQVLAARPNFDRAHNRMAAICWHIGRFKEARMAHEQAMRSNPKQRTYNLEYIYLCSGDFARAEEAAQAWLREAPGNRVSPWYVPQPPLMTGDLNLAEQRLAAGLKLYPDDPMLISLQGMLHARRNEAAAALECVRKALDLPLTFGHAHHTYYQVACVYAVLGETEKAMAWLERSVDTGNPCWPFFKIDPHLENVRPDPRFQRLVANLERQYTALKISRV
jgi:serine/threonine protein kinase/Flp pilus assembly protein TadD